LDNDRVIQFCDEIVARNIKIEFTCSAKFKPLKPEMVPRLKAAHFNHVLFGLESGDEAILKRCHKGITQQDAINAFNMFKHSGIRLTSFLIVGLPGETSTTAINTAKFVQKLQRIEYSYFSDIGILTVYPGTEIYENMKNAGKIDDSYWMTEKHVPLFTVENSIEELMHLKSLILDHISCDNIFSCKERFVKQWKLIPRIYIWKLKFIFIPRIKNYFY
jgi:anaerobic magnesium-protoporphyrin IX monomethyl ester cyclase